MTFRLVAVGIGLLVLFVAGDLRDQGEAQAVSGCCKYRPSRQEPWRATRMSFGECRDANARTDGDDVLERLGLYWWDRQCGR